MTRKLISGLRKKSKPEYEDYFILVARILLAWTFIRYGYSKLTGGQFGITSEEMSTPLENISLFKLSWYLFDHEPFKTFIGFSQLICGSLLIINKTAILGAFMFLPIATTILIIDLSFMPAGLAEGFVWRFSFYLLLNFLILWHYRERMKIIWKAVWYNISTKSNHPLWAYLLIPVMAVILEIIGMLPRVLWETINNPEKLWESIGTLFQNI